MTTDSNSTVDQKIDEITEGVYRWTVETVNDSINASPEGLKQPILGTGIAPILTPSEAREQIKKLFIEARIEELKTYEGFLESATRRIAELEIEQ